MDKRLAPSGHEGTRSGGVQLREVRKRLPLRALSEEDWLHWVTWGYVVVPDAVPHGNVQRLKALLWEFEEMEPGDPSTWNRRDRRANRMPELNQSGMVEIYNHQCLWDNRQQPRVYDAFVDVWDREDLWVSIDRANLNTPNLGPRRFGGFIHWDVDTSKKPLPANVQGVLALTDTDPEVGGFQCVPELFRVLDNWIPEQPADRDPFKPDVADFQIRFVPMKAGDLLIFNSLLAHGIRPNRSADRVRMAQYVSMYPADEGDPEARRARVRCWRELEPPQGFAFPGDPRGWEKTHGKRAELSELGKRLLGLRSWSD